MCHADFYAGFKRSTVAVIMNLIIDKRSLCLSFYHEETTGPRRAANRKKGRRGR